MNGFRRHRARTGFTLMELTLSTAIMGILLIAIAGTVMVASTALPSAETESRTSTLDTAYSIDQIAAELQEAKTITAANATNISFTVADRDNNAIDETIIYSWSGTAGDPLTRKYNARAAVTVIDNVQQFDLDYAVQAEASESKPPVVEGTEVLLFQRDATNLLGPGDWNLGAGTTIAQLVAPSLPADAASWRITRALLMLSPAGSATSTLKATVSTDAAGNPGTVIDQATFPESVLMAGFWHQVNFTTAGDLNPKEPVFITVGWESGTGIAAKARRGQNISAQGGFWAGGPIDTGYDFFIWLYGKVSVPDPKFIPPSTKTCQSIGILLNTSKSDASAVHTRALTWNEPAMP